MRIEVNYRTGSVVYDRWGSEPDLRAEIKMKIAEAMGRVLRTHNLLQWHVTKSPQGDTVVRGFVVVEPYDYKAPDYVLELNPEK